MRSIYKPALLLSGLLTLLAACSGAGPAEPPAVEVSERSPTAADPKDQLEPTATTRQRKDPANYDDYEIVTLLPPDAIPAIDNPTFLSSAEADEQYEADELIIGVNFDGDARAYSVPLLSSHEIVNDTVGGRKIAVTW